jgi:amidohydrolase
MNFKDKMASYHDYVIAMRREFHRIPELSFAEHETTKRIGEKLQELNIPFEINPEKNTGLIGVIKGDKPGPAVALRADIDALPVTEDTGLDFASEHEGVMHACGHDNHIAMLLGAAKMLKDAQSELPGTVYLVFQPAEEIGVGAPYMMNFGDWFEKSGAIFGAHIWGTFPAGKVGVRKGEEMAAT